MKNYTTKDLVKKLQEYSMQQGKSLNEPVAWDFISYLENMEVKELLEKENRENNYQGHVSSFLKTEN